MGSVRLLCALLLCLLGGALGCKKASESAASNQGTPSPVAVAPEKTNTPVEATPAFPLATNIPATTQPASAADNRSNSPAWMPGYVVKTNYPAQDVFEQAMAIVKTNVSAGAAEEAVILFRAASEKGNVPAEHALGIAYLTGLGVAKDPEQAVVWLRRAADAGHPDALFKLASLYAQGSGVVRDDKKAAELARSAAELGHAEAQYNLATLYASGRGVKKDLKEAAQWFQKAAEGGHATAQSNLGVLYATGGGVEKSPEEARKWWQKAAEQGQPSAQFNLAHLYREGKGVQKDSVEAYKWYHLAAQRGDSDAALARDALGVEMSPGDVAEALRRSREFKAKVFAKLQEFRTPE